MTQQVLLFVCHPHMQCQLCSYPHVLLAIPHTEHEGPSSTGRAAQAADGSRAPLTVPPQDGNKGMAALLRARLSSGAAAGGSGAPAGNKDIAAALRAKLGGKPTAAGSEGTHGRAGGAEEAGALGRKEVVVLPQVDASGRAAPGAFGREAGGDARRSQEVAAGGRVAKRVQRYGADGSKERYFADDDNVDLQVSESSCCGKHSIRSNDAL